MDTRVMLYSWDAVLLTTPGIPMLPDHECVDMQFQGASSELSFFIRCVRVAIVILFMYIIDVDDSYKNFFENVQMSHPIVAINLLCEKYVCLCVCSCVPQAGNSKNWQKKHYYRKKTEWFSNFCTKISFSFHSQFPPTFEVP